LCFFRDYDHAFKHGAIKNNDVYHENSTLFEDYTNALRKDGINKFPKTWTSLFAKTANFVKKLSSESLNKTTLAGLLTFKSAVGLFKADIESQVHEEQEDLNERPFDGEFLSGTLMLTGWAVHICLIRLFNRRRRLQSDPKPAAKKRKAIESVQKSIDFLKCMVKNPPTGDAEETKHADLKVPEFFKLYNRGSLKVIQEPFWHFGNVLICKIHCHTDLAAQGDRVLMHVKANIHADNHLRLLFEQACLTSELQFDEWSYRMILEKIIHASVCKSIEETTSKTLLKNKEYQETLRPRVKATRSNVKTKQNAQSQ
jgi:hypothetical protein